MTTKMLLPTLGSNKRTAYFDLRKTDRIQTLHQGCKGPILIYKGIGTNAENDKVQHYGIKDCNDRKKLFKDPQNFVVKKTIQEK
mmetsp:Transcript_7938/g.19749  ORF Transcript_7938/g.19749 Transcript_7938/m.19749 type:complete len:84 (-) Transcript_7938:125-376(-)